MDNEKALPLELLQAEADHWIDSIGGGYFSELTNMAVLTEEVGEVARIIARRYGDQVGKAGDGNADLGEELSDVLFVVLCLANQTGIDLQKAWEDRMVKKTRRDAGRFGSRG
jgi:NTP pyrophosphatase (non-canonical NTP hydrolase)